ncbi:hypothetical protein PILCRDRAFT_1893 [Piloderma croceum F 1598]|uniref:Uncharacterized protein n=1 Tax=Piloderma croceum (strain F 1598) TaxID=765440 RepID=A0A0C3CID6_PILCF|nr:hypothetical protein PILCRDRAFT_1893 [Piloderma croceum F 1598]
MMGSTYRSFIRLRSTFSLGIIDPRDIANITIYITLPILSLLEGLLANSHLSDLVVVFVLVPDHIGIAGISPAPAALLAGQGTIPLQLKVVEEFCALEAAKHATAIALTIEVAGVGTPTPPTSWATSPDCSNTPAPSTSCSSGKKRAYVKDSNDNDERAFSQGDITISKQHNHLKGDIVEALQCIKCAIRHDLLFCEVGPSSLVEEKADEYEVEDDFSEQDDDDVVDEDGWDDLFLEEDEDALKSDADMNELIP